MALADITERPPSAGVAVWPALPCGGGAPDGPPGYRGVHARAVGFPYLRGSVVAAVPTTYLSGDSLESDRCKT